MVYIVFLEKIDHTSSSIVVHTSDMMKILWILSAIIGFTLSEKLDRTYLPPPGAKFSGGSPGDLDIPLEFPKETYAISSEDKNFERPEIVIGMNRVGPNTSPERYGDISSTVPPFHGNSHSFPTTTTSYAFSQTTSYIPAAGSTFGPETLINSKYPFNNSNNNLNPAYFGEKYLNSDYTRPNNVNNAAGDKQIVKDPINSPENQFSDNKINFQEVNNINNESAHPYNGDINNDPENNLYSGDLGISGITSSPIDTDHSFLNNNYDTYHSPSLLETINPDLNIISSTSVPSDSVYSKTPSTLYPYRTFPERKRAQDDRKAVILNYDNTITPEGYSYSFDTSNGIHADEKGTTINGVQAVGSYSYIGDDGQLYSVSYTADEKGFRPYGAHLPTAPPIPDAILKVIEQAAIDKANGIYDDGSYDDKKYGYQKYNPSKNIPFSNQYDGYREGTNLNKNKNNNQLPHYSRIGENGNHNKDMDTKKKNNQDITTENKLEPFVKKESFNESVSEISPNYKNNPFENIGKDQKDSTYKQKLQNKKLNSMSHLQDKEDNVNSTEFYDETGYHYSKPPNDHSLKVADKFINRFLDIPASNKIPAEYNIVENIPARPFMTPYVSRNDDISLKHDGDSQTFNIPAKEEENIILNNQNINPFKTLVDTDMVPEKTQNTIVNDFDNQFKQSDITPSDDQEYLNNKKVNSNNDGYVPLMTSTETGLSDFTSTAPTAFPSRFNIESSKDQNSRKHLNHPASSSISNPDILPNRSLDQEKYRKPISHSNKLNYGNYDDDITDSGSKNNNMHGPAKDYILENSTTITYKGEDFSGPKQAQKYDPLTGYHY